MPGIVEYKETIVPSISYLFYILINYLQNYNCEQTIWFSQQKRVSKRTKTIYFGPCRMEARDYPEMSCKDLLFLISCMYPQIRVNMPDTRGFPARISGFLIAWVCSYQQNFQNWKSIHIWGKKSHFNHHFKTATIWCQF